MSTENQSLLGFLLLQYAKQRILELYYNFFEKFCDADKYEELEMDTDSLYFALSEENLEDVVLPEKRDKWNGMRSGDCKDTFTANATGNFFLRRCCKIHKKHDKMEPGLFKEEFRCTEMLCLCFVVTTQASFSFFRCVHNWRLCLLSQNA